VLYDEAVLSYNCVKWLTHGFLYYLRPVVYFFQDVETSLNSPAKKSKKYAGADDDNDDEPEAHAGSSSLSASSAAHAASNKYGVGGINRCIAKPQNKLYSFCPLHLAAHNGHTVCFSVTVIDCH